MAERLARFGFLRREDTGEDARFEITPPGRQHIALAGPKVRKRRAQPDQKERPGDVRLPAKRADLRTVSDFQAAGATIIAQCEACAFITRVDLDLFAWRFGARAVLRGRREPCVIADCEGQATYFAKAPGGRFDRLDEG